MSDEIEVPVLIVGAGPAGLTTAITLARHGVASLLVERRAEPSGLPRATAVSTRSMELMRAWGLQEQVLAGSADAEIVGRQSETLAGAGAGLALPLGMPTRAQSAVISPTAPACVPQDHLEPVLTDHLRSHETARIWTGVQVADVRSTPDGVRALICDAGIGARRTVRARYLVAADGAHSTVRRALGIAMDGPDRLAERVVVLFHAPLREVVGEPRCALYVTTGTGGVNAFLPAGRGDRWLYGYGWEPGRERLSAHTPARIAERIRTEAGAAHLDPRIERIGAFSFAAQLAQSFRRDSAFLVGDAAHRVSPRGGTGMNTAIHDGHDLGWKLAWVLRGWAAEALLDTYERDRRPVAEHNLARSADPNGSVREAAGELHVDLGGRIAHVWTAPGRSTLDLLGSGLTLFTGPDATGWDEAAAGVDKTPPVAVHRLDAITARTLGVRGGGALLARPDGVPVGVWTSSDAPAQALGMTFAAVGHAPAAPLRRAA
jgi:putative polyketide hydroxylase